MAGTKWSTEIARRFAYLASCRTAAQIEECVAWVEELLLDVHRAVVLDLYAFSKADDALMVDEISKMRSTFDRRRMCFTGEYYPRFARIERNQYEKQVHGLSE